MYPGLILANESADADLTTDELPAEEATEVVATVADDSAAVQAEGDEAAITVSQLEDAVQGGEELEAQAEIAVDAVDSGEGVDEDAAESIALAVESIRSRLGFPAGRIVNARESFGQAATRLHSTKLIVESVGATLKTIWGHIKAALVRLWEKIKSFFAGLFRSTGMLTKLIADLRARATKLGSNAKMKEKTISHAGVAKAFTIKGKADKSTMEKVVKNSDKLAEVADNFGALTKEVASYAERLAAGEMNEAAVKAFLASKENASSKVASLLSSAFDAADSEFSSDELKAVAKKPKTSKDGSTTTNYYGPFVNHSVLALTVSKTTVLGTTTSSFAISIGAAPGKAAEKVAALGQNEVLEVLAQAAKKVNKLNDWKRVQSNFDAVTKSQVKVADTVMSNAEKMLDKTGSSSETRQGLAEMKEAVNSSIQALGAFGARAPGLDFAVIKAMADYASISLRNLSAA